MKFFASLVSIMSTKKEKLGNAESETVSAVTASSGESSAVSEVYGLHGLVSRPAKGARGVRLRIGNTSIVVAVFNYGIAAPDNPGETKLYSTDADGAEKASLTLRADGTSDLENAQEKASQLFSDLIDAISALQTVGAPPQHVVSPSSRADLEALKQRFAALWS
jgi:hypothetical protein